MICPRCNYHLPDGFAFCPYCGKKLVQTPRRRKRRSSGTGCISHLSGKRSRPYMARKDGVCIGTYSTVAEAERALAAVMDEPVTQKYNMTFEQVYEAWLPEHSAVLQARAVALGKSPAQKINSVESYQTAYKHCGSLYAKTFRRIQRYELQAVIDRAAADGLGVSSRKKIKCLFGQLYQWAIAEKIVQVNLSDAVVIVPEPKREKQIFAAEEIRLFQRCGDPAAGIVLILIGTGCRIGELFSARTADCYDGYFVGGEKTAAGIGRVIPVTALAAPYYMSLLSNARQSGTERLIEAYEGNHSPENYRKREYYPMLDALGISREKTPHCARHTFATLAVRDGVRPEDLKRILGHASYDTTLTHYDHPGADQLVQAAQAIHFEK